MEQKGARARVWNIAEQRNIVQPLAPHKYKAIVIHASAKVIGSLAVFANRICAR